MKPLTGAQKSTLAALLRDAWKYRREKHAEARDFDAWRAEAVRVATGGQCLGLRECGQEHFKPVKATALLLAGRDAEAFEIHTSRPDDTAQLVFAVEAALKKHGFTDAYANAVTRGKFGVRDWRELTAPDALRALLVTLNARGNSKTKQPF